MLGFLFGLMIGGFIGLCVMAVIFAAAREDKWMEQNNSQQEL